jgi:transposase
MFSDGARAIRSASEPRQGTRTPPCRGSRLLPEFVVSRAAGSRWHGCSGSRMNPRARREPHGQPGNPPVDDRPVITGILHVPKVGCRCQVTPSADGPHTTIDSHSNRWSQRGVAASVCQDRSCRPRPGRVDARRAPRESPSFDRRQKRGLGAEPSGARAATSRATFSAWPMVVADRLRSP